MLSEDYKGCVRLGVTESRPFIFVTQFAAITFLQVSERALTIQLR